MARKRYPGYYLSGMPVRAATLGFWHGPKPENTS